MEEIWRSIKDYEGLYEVSNWGRVRSLGFWVNNRDGSRHWKRGCVLQPGKQENGYLIVVLYKDGVKKTCTVHRLVAMAFLSNPDNLPQVNHKDENKENNRVENLEWCDGPYNIRYSKAKTVYQYTLDGKLAAVWPSTIECERQTGFNNACISKCCIGKRKIHKGFRWTY